MVQKFIVYMYTSIQEIKGIVIQQFYPESKLKTFSKELLDGLVSIFAGISLSVIGFVLNKPLLSLYVHSVRILECWKRCRNNYITRTFLRRFS
jgi:hypothetical protein